MARMAPMPRVCMSFAKTPHPDQASIFLAVHDEPTPLDEGYPTCSSSGLGREQTLKWYRAANGRR
eukprot:6371735-Amphidinium_carterae.1